MDNISISKMAGGLNSYATAEVLGALFEMVNLFSGNGFLVRVYEHGCGTGGFILQVWFGNGYGASIAISDNNIGGKSGFWEVAVLGDFGKLVYDTPVTDDVIGYCDTEEVWEICKQIMALPKD